LHNWELNGFYPHETLIGMEKSWRMKWVGHVACMGGKRHTFRLLVEKPVCKGPLRGCMCRWEDNVKMDLQEMGWEAWHEFM
jgi:hypothetical protein